MRGGLRGAGWVRGATVQTDGVSLCVVFKQAATAALVQPDVAAAPPASRKRKRGSPPPPPPALGANDVVLGVDPGRTTLMHGVVRAPDGGVREFALSRAAFYSASGKDRRDARVARWNSEVAAEHAALAAAPPKTADGAAFDAHLAAAAAAHAAMWAHKLPLRWGREGLRHHVLKHRAMDRWLGGVKAALEALPPASAAAAAAPRRIRVAYGAARFSPTGAGEPAPAPTAFQFARLALAFGADAVGMVDEFCTSKCCAACGARGVTSVLQDVYDPKTRVEGRRWHAVRGLKRCGSTECCSFRHRDANGALNILAAYEAAARGAPRPRHLVRDNDATAAPRGRWELAPPSAARSAARAARRAAAAAVAASQQDARDPQAAQTVPNPEGTMPFVPSTGSF